MTNIEQPSAETGSPIIKPFRLVKFFSFTGLIVFFVSTILLVWLITNHTKKMLISRSEAYAQVLAENLNHQVFQQFVIPTLERYGTIALSNPAQFRRLDSIVTNTIHGLNMESVTIFDRDEGIISYSTEPERVGKLGQGTEGYQRALDGQNNSSFIASGSPLRLPGGERGSSRLITYVPFRQEVGPGQDTGVIMGVFEIVQDLSADFEALLRLQGAIIGTAVVVMSGMFVVLRLIVARADRIIELRAVERRRLEEKLNHAERLAGLGQMVASVSHEIKNPLGIVRSTAEILGKRLKTVAPGNEHLAAIIVDETSRLDGIVREFLDFARPQQPKLSPTNVNELVGKALRFMQPELDKVKVEVVPRLDPDLPEVAADHELFYRALLNLLINAVQAMPEGGRLTVTTGPARGAGRTIFLEIADTGLGMTPEIREQIFTPFFTAKTRGTGLGLSIAKNIVDSHQGTITASSEPGQGATFRVEL